MNKKRLIPLLTTYTLILGVIFPSTPVNAAVIKNIVSDPASPVHSESVTGNISENSTPSDIMRSSAREFSEDLLAPESEDDLFEEAIDNFKYVDANGNVVEISGSAVKLTDETDVSDASRQDYYVDGTVEINHGLNFGGTNINLILRNNSTLRITNTSGSGITANNLYILVEEGSTAENQGKIIINSSDNCIKSTSSFKIYGGGIDCTCTANNIPAILCSNTFETYRSPVISIRTNGVGIESDSDINRIILSGGKITITGSTNAYAIWGKHSIDISGDATELTITSSGRGISANQTVTINGGTINITNTQAQGIYANYYININGGKTNISSTGNALESETITVTGGQTKALSSGGTGFFCRSSLKFLFKPFDSYVIASSYNKSVNTMSVNAMNNPWDMKFLCVDDGSIISNGSDMSGYGGKRIVRYCGDSGYSVLVDDNISHGTVTANTYGNENLPANTRVTLTLTPDNGYTIASVTLTKPDQTTVELTGNNGTYVFTPVAGLNRISVSFVELTPVYYVDETDTRCFVYPEKLTASSAGVNLTRSAYYVDGELNITENSIHFTNDAILILKKNSRLTINNTRHENVHTGAKAGIIADGNLKIYVEEGSTSANQGTIEVLSEDGKGIKVYGDIFLINGGNIIADAPYSKWDAYAIDGTSINIRNANVKLNTRSSAMDRGLHSRDSINIENSTLEIKAGASGANALSGSTGIYASNNLTVTGAQSSISVTSGAWGILCNNGNAVFENGTLTVNSLNEAIKAKNITINGNSKITASSTAANKNAIYISDNTGRLTFGFTSPGFIQASSYGHSAVASDAAFGTANLITGSRNYFNSTGLIVVNGSNLKSLAGEKIHEGFTINLSDVENGTLAVNKSSGNPGDEIIVTPTPNTGYVVSRVTYTNSSDTSGPQEIIADANGQYRFIINASAPYTVSATFIEKTENVSYINEQGTTRVANNAVFLSKGGDLSGSAYYVEGNITLTQGINFTNTSPTILILKKGSHLTVNNATGNGISSSGNLKIFITSDSSSSDWGSLTINSTGGKGINNTAGTFTLAGGNINITASDDAVNSNGFIMTGGCLTANGGNGFSGIKLSNTATFSIDLPAGSFLKASSYSDGNASSTPFNSANFNQNGKAYVCIESGEAFTAATMKSITNKTVKAGYNVVVDGSIVKGTLTSDKSGGISGETVTLTPSPDTYYEISRVTYTDSNGTHNVNKNAAGKYTFSASSGMNTVSAIFTPINYTITYNDVDGATFTGGNNPSTYNVESPAIRIKNPDRNMAIFKGWEGTDINGKSMNLIIPAGSHGNRTFTATWKSINEGTVDNGDYNNGYSTEKAESFIHNLYRGILDREADESGLNYWTNQLKDKKISLYQLVKGFTDSTEFTGRGLSDADFIRALYKGVLSRDPAQNEVDSWLDQMNNNGYTRDDVIAGFLYSKELINLQSEISESLGNGKTLPIVYFNQGIYDFVIRNYVCILDREGEPGGVEYWGRILLAGEKTPEEVTMGFLHSPEFRAKRISSEDYVKILYRTFLGREADEEGLKYWVNKLKNGSSREGIVPGFSDSEEFKALLKSYGL